MFSDQFYQSVPVVGVTFDDRQNTISRLRVGDKLFLVREPWNPYDSNAIAVETIDGDQIGYLSRDMARQLAEGMDSIGSEQIPGEVRAIIGGYSYAANLGVRISFTVPALV